MTQGEIEDRLKENEKEQTRLQRELRDLRGRGVELRLYCPKVEGEPYREHDWKVTEIGNRMIFGGEVVPSATFECHCGATMAVFGVKGHAREG